MVDLTALVQAIVALATALITTFLIPYIKTKHSTEEIQKTIMLVDVLVASAEQIAPAFGFDGKQKKEYVLSKLEALGYHVDDTICDYIESSVLTLKADCVEQHAESFSNVF